MTDKTFVMGGDWTCPKCGFTNPGAIEECMRCHDKGLTDKQPYEMKPEEIKKITGKAIVFTYDRKLASAAQQKMIDLGWVSMEQQIKVINERLKIQKAQLEEKFKADLLSPESIERVAGWLRANITTNVTDEEVHSLLEKLVGK